MADHSKFLTLLQEIKEIGVSQQNKLSKEEIKKYLGDKDLTIKQMQAVYQYLSESGIEVEGYQMVEIEKPDTSEEKDNSHTKADRNMELYKKELTQIKVKENDIELIERFIKGDLSAKNTIIEMRLQSIVNLAEKYEKRSVPKDELIAEGNMGLILGMNTIENDRKSFILPTGDIDIDKFNETLDIVIKETIENYIDEEMSSKDWEQTVLAKTNLLHEATKYLSEEFGRVPTVDELSQYTHIEPWEIESIMDLSEDARRVANGKKRKKHNINLKK